MGWRERFGGDDERARIAARARALLDTTGAGPSPGPVGSGGSGASRGVPPSWSAAVAGSAPADPAPSPPPAADPPGPRRGGWVPTPPALTAATLDPAGGRHAVVDRSGSVVPSLDVELFPRGDLFAGDDRFPAGDPLSLRRDSGDSGDSGDDDRDGRGAGLRSLRDRVRWDPGRRGLVAVAAVVVVVGSVAGGLVVKGGSSSAVTVAAASGAAPAAASAAPVAGASPASASPSGASSSPSPTGTVTVDVAGLVVAPGVYTLPAGSRVEDALAAAGGAQPGADLSTLNRARVLVDGEQLAVGVAGAVAGAPAATGSAAGTAGPAGLVDLNTAGPEQLDTLPGVGPVLAQAIIAWRTDHGRFGSVDDLQNVSGIGPSRFADLKALVTV